MVINNILSRYQEGPAPWAGGARKISGGPLYSCEELTRLLANGGEAIKLLTRKCIADTSELALDLDDLAALITEGVRFSKTGQVVLLVSFHLQH